MYTVKLDTLKYTQCKRPHMGPANIPDDSTVKPVTLQPVVALSQLAPFTAHKGSFCELWNTFKFYTKARLDQLSSYIKVRPANRVAHLNLLATCHVPILRSTASDATVANPLVKRHTVHTTHIWIYQTVSFCYTCILDVTLFSCMVIRGRMLRRTAQG